MNTRLRLVPVVALVLACAARGQDLASGPAKGRGVPPLKVFAATGPDAGEEVDYAARRKGRATIYAFVRAGKWDRPMARFLKKLDEAVGPDDPAAVVAVWLTDRPEKTREYLPVAQQSLQFRSTALTLFPGDAAGPKEWTVNGDAHLTAVLARGGKVVGTFGYLSVNESAVREVMQAFRAPAGKK